MPTRPFFLSTRVHQNPISRLSFMFHILIACLTVATTLALAKKIPRAVREDTPPPIVRSFIRLSPIPKIPFEQNKPSPVTIVLDVLPGYHIQANPPGAPGLIPTQVQIQPPPGLEKDWIIGPIAYPLGSSYRLTGIPFPLQVYSHHVEITVPITLKSPLNEQKPVRLAGSITYQACSSKTCFQPRTEPFTIKVASKH